MIYYDNPACHDSSDPLRAMARRLVETRWHLRDRNEVITELLEGRDRDRHARHGVWRRWRITGRVASWAYALGITAGSGTTWNGHCNACTTFSWRGRRPYRLGWTRERWACLLIGHHRRRELPGTDICAVCAPCHQCRSADPLHDAWQCELDADQAARVAAALAGAGAAAATATVVRATADGPEEVAAIRTAVDGLVATPTRGAPGWTLTHVGTGRALTNRMYFDDLDAARRAAERLAGFGDYASDPREWPQTQRDALVAELGDLVATRLFEERAPDGPGPDELAPAAGARR